MTHNWQKNYPTVSENELGENLSLTKMLKLIGHNKRVVDFGCATGYFARLLNNRGCKVVGVEINEEAAKIAEQFCEQVVVADLDIISLAKILPEHSFDVAVFGDVLEHLRNPWQVLQEVHHILKPDAGYVVASIPNIAHGAIRLALLHGKFEYAELGILDNTHLRFFTRRTVEELFENTGYVVDVVDRTILPVFSESQVAPQLKRENYSPDLIQQIEQEEESSTLQFVLRAYPASPSGKYAALKTKYSKLLDEMEETRSQTWKFQSELELTQNHVHNIEQALEVTRNHAENLEAQLKAAQTDLQAAQTDLQAAQVDREKFQQAKATVRQLKQELLDTQTELEHKKQELIHTQLRLSAFESHFHTAQTQLNQKKEKIQLLRNRIEHKQTELLQAQERITAMESSKFWQLRNAWIKVKRTVGLTQEATTPFVIAGAESRQLVPTQPEKQKKSELTSTNNQSSAETPQPTLYEQWIQHNTSTSADLKRMAEIAKVFAYKPLISIIVPTYNTPEAYLREAIDSVLAQIYPHWELCLADDASTEPYVREILEEYAMADSRIKVVFREENGHISASSNSALELATGDYIALLDHDDVLAPEALYEVAFLINQHPEADMIYSDEDKLDEDGKRKDPFFKPDWCPDSFLSRMYTCHLGIYRRSIVNEIGGFRLGFEGGQDYDLVLRFTEKTDRIFHIPKVLYHWRIHSGSVASASSAKPYAYRAAEKAIVEALARRGEVATVKEIEEHPGCYITRYKIADPKLVSIIIPTRDLGHMVNQCLESIFTKSTYPNYEVLLIDNGSTEKYTEKVISEWLNREPDRFRCYALGIPFNYSKINNFAVTKARGDFLLFLNNDTEVIAPDWIEAMVEQAQRPSIGAVGALLYYPDDTIQHAGVVLGIGSVAGHSHKYYKSDEAGYFSQVITINNYSAVTGACLMCRRKVFEEVEGFNEEFAVAFNDIDLCLKILDRGYRNIYVPHAKLYHHESKSRGYDTTPEKQARFLKESEQMKQSWQHLIEQDPCYSPNLTTIHENYSIREYEDPYQRELMNKLRQAQKRAKRLETQLEQVREEKDQAIGRVEAMETSKFWKLRKRWFKVRRLIGASGQE